MKVLIAGAGIGGLTAALCLQKSGHEVQVFEQSSALSEAGAGIQCGANALRVLDYLNLLDELEPFAVAPERVDFKDSVSGQTLYSSEWGTRYAEKYGAPYWHLHRADLQNSLLNALDKPVTLNASLTAYSESNDDVSITLANGREFTGDCLIGADGIKSRVRSQLLRETHSAGLVSQLSKPRFTGHVAWRGLVPVERLPANFMDKIASNFMGQHKHMVIYYVRNQQLINFIGVVERPTLSEENKSTQVWVETAPWAELKADFAGWHPTVQTLIDAVDQDQCYRWALYDHQPLKNWSSERVTLLGDAAHATLPYMASGAAMAIEDARILQRALNDSASVASGLRLYQNSRMARTAAIQSNSAQLGKLYHVQNPLLLKLAFKALHFVGKRKEDFLPSYDANTVAL